MAAPDEGRLRVAVRAVFDPVAVTGAFTFNLNALPYSTAPHSQH